MQSRLAVHERLTVNSFSDLNKSDSLGDSLISIADFEVTIY